MHIEKFIMKVYRKILYYELLIFFHQIQIFTFIFLFVIKYVCLYRLIFAKVLFKIFLWLNESFADK